MKHVVASVILMAALATGQTWIAEQVDSSAANGFPVESVKAPDGRLWACHETAGGFLRVACLGDSGWRITDVGPGSITNL